MPYSIGHPITQILVFSHRGKAGGQGLEFVNHGLNLLHQLHRFYFLDGLVKVFDNSLMCFSGAFGLSQSSEYHRKRYIAFAHLCIGNTPNHDVFPASEDRFCNLPKRAVLHRFQKCIARTSDYTACLLSDNNTCTDIPRPAADFPALVNHATESRELLCAPVQVQRPLRYQAVVERSAPDRPKAMGHLSADDSLFRIAR